MIHVVAIPHSLLLSHNQLKILEHQLRNYYIELEILNLTYFTDLESTNEITFSVRDISLKIDIIYEINLELKCYYNLVYSKEMRLNYHKELAISIKSQNYIILQLRNIKLALEQLNISQIIKERIRENIQISIDNYNNHSELNNLLTDSITLQIVSELLNREEGKKLSLIAKKEKINVVDIKHSLLIYKNYIKNLEKLYYTELEILNLKIYGVILNSKSELYFILRKRIHTVDIPVADIFTNSLETDGLFF